MSDMTTTAAGANKALWAAIGVLGVAVVGLGGALIYTQTQSPEQPAAAMPAPTQTAPMTAAEPARAPQAEKTTPAAAHKQAVAPAKPMAQAAPTAATSASKPAPAKSVCPDCATVTTVTPMEREGQASGAGAVAGGVLGAVIGNQISQGQGKDVATIVGAIGGGIAGHQVEKKMKKVTVYQVELRMDDGSRRTLELAEPVGVGTRVRVEGNNVSRLP